jgi:type III secretory pathway component EscV
MTSVRVGCFATAMLGFLYGVLALMGGVKTDVIAGLVVALVGIVGWGIASYWEGRK